MQSNISTFEEAVEYLYDIPRFTSKNSMKDTMEFLKCLGNPDKTMKIIHVAGTNGKGSVCAYLRSILEAAGMKVAVFISPHLVDIRERFMIKGKMVEKEVFLQAFHTIYQSSYQPTYFEFLFFMAMLIFSKEDIDYCILETGLGGRLDATNSISSKELTLITSIGLDHTEYLGETLAQVAEEKAGIVAEGTPLVFSDTDSEVTDILVRKAHEMSSPVYPLSKKDYTFLNFKNKTIDFSFQSRYYGYISFVLPTIALYQMENAALAVRGAEVLLSADVLTPSVMKKGVMNCYWPGRMEEILPDVFVDGAHNPEGMKAFLESVKNDGYSGRRKLLFSALMDKQFEEMLHDILSENVFSFIAIAQMNEARCASLEQMEDIVKKYPECTYELYSDVSAAYHDLLANQKEDERIYIAGSLYLVGSVRRISKARSEFA